MENKTVVLRQAAGRAVPFGVKGRPEALGGFGIPQLKEQLFAAVMCGPFKGLDAFCILQQVFG